MQLFSPRIDSSRICYQEYISPMDVSYEVVFLIKKNRKFYWEFKKKIIVLCRQKIEKMLNISMSNALIRRMT